jgi:hypothetical protein
MAEWGCGDSRANSGSRMLNNDGAMELSISSRLVKKYEKLNKYGVR